ncbi:MAG TPA: glycosyltransferase family 2 protein [Candidatus Binatia bacterium]|jgi:glycosyltransferase involved in cell wall biosynthesis|nr:glycosyltransferase family 2 protein [Candidatus Binatia bacterium]
MTDPGAAAPRFTVVVPVFNEAVSLPALADELRDVMRRMSGGYECILVDDGSTDGTAAVIDALTGALGSSFRGIRFARNRGQAAALYAGLHQATGSIVIVLDGDGQNRPQDIPLMVDELLRRNLDLVCGIRVDRDDPWLRRSMSRLANGVRSRFLHDHVRDSGCALKAMRRPVIATLPPIRTLYSFIPAFAAAAGFVVGECPVGHRARQGGTSSYGLRAFLWRPMIDMLGVRWYAARSVLTRDDLMAQDDASVSVPRPARREA